MEYNGESVAFFSYFKSINDLPKEILIQIANKLNTKDLKFLSQTCKLWNDIACFVMDRRGPQFLVIKMHSKFDSQDCRICYRPAFFPEFDYSRCLSDCCIEDLDRSFPLCEDQGPAEKILNDLLYCDPQCVIMFGTHSIIGTSRIVNQKLKTRVSQNSCHWLTIKTFGVKMGDECISCIYDGSVGLFFPGEVKIIDTEKSKDHIMNNERKKLFSIKLIDPGSNKILKAWEASELYCHIHLPMYYVYPDVDKLLLEDSFEDIDPFFSKNHQESSFSTKNIEGNYIILMFFSNSKKTKKYMKLFFQDIFYRYFCKLARLSVFGIEVNEKLNLNDKYYDFLPDIVIEKPPFLSVCFSNINTNRSFWTMGTIDLFKDENYQKACMIRDKKKLNVCDSDILNSKEKKYQRLSMLGLCSIPENDWNARTRTIEKNLKEIYPFLNFTYTLRGQNFGQILFDELISVTESPEQQNDACNWFEEKTDVSYSSHASYFVMITKNA